jgi:parallel beta-helix repeat protein
MKTQNYLYLAVGLCLFASISFCGQDDPLGPPGSDAAHMKSLNQIEPRTIISSLPYVITNRGSYYLTESLTATLPTNGIIIAASDVTIDLNGFMLIGVTNMGACGIAEVLSTNLQLFVNLTIRNGVVSGWGNAGVSMWDGMNCRLSGITAYENGSAGGTGIIVGKDWDVDNCLVYKNYGIGMSVADYTRVRNCKARQNLGNGFHTGIGSVIENCVSAGNGQSGFFGQTLSKISDCVALCNTNDGIYVGPNSIATRNLSGQNGGSGISAGASSRLTENLSSYNGVDGINVGGDAYVTHNQSTGNRGSGIYGGNGCRVEGNHCTYNGFGVMTAANSAGSLFVGNTAFQNSTNYFTSNSRANVGRVAGATDLGGNFIFSNPWANFDLAQ